MNDPTHGFVIRKGRSGFVWHSLTLQNLSVDDINELREIAQASADGTQRARAFRDRLYAEGKVKHAARSPAR